MLFRAVHFAARRFGLAAAVTLGLSAGAQQTIQFSKPIGDDPAGKANAFMPESARLNPGSFNAPSSLFGGQGPAANFDVLPGSPQPDLSGAAAQWQKLRDKQNNWTLMTPSEILGVPTAEQILGITDPNDNPNLSPEERFLQRQDRQSAMTASNALRRADADALLWHDDNVFSDPARGVFQNPDDQAALARSLTGLVPGPDRNGKFNSRGNLLPGNLPGANQTAGSVWVSPFDSPAPLPKPTPEQLAGMDRFRALFDPPPPEKTPASEGVFGQPAPVPMPDPNLQVLPLANRSGHSFAALQNDIAKPTGLMPLPSVTGPVTPPKKASPLAQPPPWLQNPLDSSSLPQRQY